MTTVFVKDCICKQVSLVDSIMDEPEGLKEFCGENIEQSLTS